MSKAKRVRPPASATPKSPALRVLATQAQTDARKRKVRQGVRSNLKVY